MTDLKSTPSSLRVTVIFFILGFISLEVECTRSCYKCLVQDGCLKLHFDAPKRIVKCDEGIDHCVISRTESKVTGAIATDHFCGGKIYDVTDPSLKDGCFEKSQDSFGDRTKKSICYCSHNLCNSCSSLLGKCTIILIIFSIFTNTKIL